MARKFLDGLVFGAGFAISFLAIWFIASFLLMPQIMSSRMKVHDRPGASSVPEARFEDFDSAGASPPGKPFYALGIDDQIKQATVIALARYERAPDGKMKAVIKEFLKKDPKTTVYYEVGDEFAEASYYPREGADHGDGVVIFFTGSPAHMAMSTTFSGDRIEGLGDLPIALFRTKCREPGK